MVHTLSPKFIDIDSEIWFIVIQITCVHTAHKVMAEQEINELYWLCQIKTEFISVRFKIIEGS